MLRPELFAIGERVCNVPTLWQRDGHRRARFRGDGDVLGFETRVHELTNLHVDWVLHVVVQPSYHYKMLQ